MISKYSVKKPYTVLVGVILVIVLGIVSLSKMTTDLLPNMSFPYALIITTDVGASPEKVESEVTAPIESSMATTSNIKNITSTSYNSYSIVVLEYEQNANMDSVMIEIQQTIDQLKGNWSDSVGTPMIMQIDPDMMPVLTAAVDVDGMSASEISDYVANELSPQLESIEGVASVSTTGAIEENIKVTMNQEKIDALNQKIQDAIHAQFTEAQAQIDDGKAQIESGKAAIQSGTDQITDAAGQINEQKNTLYQTRSDLTSKLAELNSQKDMLEQVYDGINEFMQSDSYAKLAVMDQGIQTIEKSLAEAAQLQNTELMQQLQTQINTYKEQLNTANAEIANQFSGLQAMGITVNNYTDLKAAKGQVANMLTQMKTGIATLQAALDQVESGQVALEDAMDTLNYNAVLGALQSSSASADLATAAASLDDAQKTLDSSKDSALAAADLNSVLTVDTLSGILTAQNFDMPAGYAQDGDTSYLVRVGEAVTSVDDLENLVLMDMHMEGIDPIHLSDVADVEIADNSDESYAVINGNPGIMLSMEKQTGYSTGDVTDRILDKFDALESSNTDLHFSVLMNQGIYIDMIVKNVMENMIFGALLAVVVLLLFLKDIKPTLVIACSIPLSVIFAVVLMYFTGITLNIISMSGLALGIGMLVDNSIVVIENIYRLRGEGMSIRQAAVQGAGQVTGAIVASTLTTVSVYAPIVFTEGITRQLFVDIALTILFTLTASLIVALTFVPAMGSVLLKKTKEIKHPLFDRIRDGYGRFLALCLRFKPVVFIVAVGLLAVSAAASVSKGFTFMDMDMDSDQMSVTIKAKDDEKLTFDELTKASDDVISRISDIDGIETIGAMAGGNSTMSMMGGSTDSVTMYIILDEDSDVTGEEVAQEITDRTSDMDVEVDAEASAMDMSSYFASGLSVQIKGDDIDKLQELAAQAADVVKNTEGTTDVDDGLDDVTPQFTITVDKEKAAEYGYTVAQVYQLVYGEMADSKSATTISTDLKDYEVYVQTEDQADTTLDDIKNLSFTYTDRQGNDTEVALSDICSFEDNTTLSTITRDAQTRYITVSAGVDDDHNVTLVSNAIKDGLKSIDVPDGYSIEMTGEDETIHDAMNQLILMLVLAVIFIYLIMVAQFQSFTSPFIIMFTIPLAFTGGFFALFFTGHEIGVVSMLGFIMLAGLIVNNGIVLIDYINQARKEGVSKKEAIVDAGKTRLRPILMTAMTTIISMMTMAMGIGSGSEMMQPMAITMIGGMVYGTLLTLVVVPCIYDAFHKEKSMVEEEL